MKNLPLLFILCLFYHASSAQHDLNMLTDWEEAKAAAQTEDKPILVILTGSNWCKPCMKMEREVFGDQEFQRWSKEHLVLFLIDVRTVNGSIQAESEEWKNYNTFKERYKAQTLPALILTDGNGKKIDALKKNFSKPNKVLEWLSQHRS
ncbi:MAG: thioredoxin family protein [Bacteroidota bacterium]